MKYLITLLIAALSLNAFSQVSLPFPYNPDSDGDQLIGVTDLQSLLSSYGQEFLSGSFQFSGDSTLALTNVGVLDYFTCKRSCKQLDGQWEVLRFENVILLSEQLESFAVANQTSGFHTDQMERLEVGSDGNVYFNLDTNMWGTNGGDAWLEERNCVCQTSTVPYIEYSLCTSTYSFDDLLDCVNTKLSEGWLPLGGITRGGNASLVRNVQAFWRWAE